MKSVLILPDLQVPYHDPRFIRVMESFIQDFQPDEIGQIGDLMDQPQPSRWNKGLAGEYERTLQNDIDQTKDILSRLSINWVKMGNHDERIEAYVERYAPALSSLGCLRLEDLLGLNDRGIALHREPFELAPGHIVAHGHEGSLSAVSGRTAFGLAKRYDRSVICGHTHRAGIVSETVGIGKHRRTISGIEVGHGMDLKYATYVKSPNWQQAFAMMYVEGKTVQVELIPVTKSRFIYQGKKYQA